MRYARGPPPASRWLFDVAAAGTATAGTATAGSSGQTRPAAGRLWTEDLRRSRVLRDPMHLLRDEGRQVEAERRLHVQANPERVLLVAL